MRLPLRLRLGLVRGPRQGFSFGVQGFPELIFASSVHVLLSLCHLRPRLLRRRPRGPRLLEEGEAPFLRRDNAGRGLRRPCHLLTASPFCRGLSSCCSFRLVPVPLSLLFVAGSQLLQDDPQTDGLPAV